MNAHDRTPSCRRKVVVGVHVTANSVAAVRRAVREAVARHAELEVVHVVPDGYPGAGAAAREVHRLISQNVLNVQQVKTSIRVESGEPGEVLVRLSADAELLVIGACSNSERRGIYAGDVVPYCIASSRCPVAVCADHGANRNTVAAATGPPRVLALVG